MSDQDLQYTLTVSTDDANKTMEALFSKWEKRAEGIGTSLSKGMSEGASKGKGADAAAKGLDAVGNSATSAEKALARMEKQEQALWAASDKLDASLRKQAEAFRSLGNSGAAAEVEKLRTALMDAANMDKANIGKGTLLPTANVDAFIASNKLLIQGYNEDIKAQKEVAKTSEETHASRIATAQKLNDTEKLIRAEKYADNAAYQAEVVASHQRTAAALNTILQNSAGKSKAQIEQEISAVMRLESAKIKSAQASAQAQLNSLYASTTAMNKAVMGVYAVQQAVEDYSYAGPRGAANNLAMLAAMIGGSTGIVAMFGLLTLNIAESSGALDGFAQALGMTWVKTKEQNDELKSFIENIDRLQKLQYDYEKKQADFNPVDKKNADLEQQKAALQVTIDQEKERANKAAEAVFAYEKMAEIAKELGSYADLGITDLGLLNETAETIAKNMDTIRREGGKVVSDRFKFTPAHDRMVAEFNQQLALFEKYQKQFEQASGQMVSEEAFKKLTENSKEFNDTLDKSVSKMRELNEQQSILKQAGIDPSKLAELEKKQFEVSSSYNMPSGDAGKKLRDAIKDINESYDKSVESLKKQQELDNAATSDMQRKVEIARNYDAQLELQAAHHELATREAEKNATALEGVLSSAEKITKELEKQINASEKIIENAEKEIQALDKKKAAWLDTEAKRKAAALDKIDDLMVSEKMDQIDEKLKNGPQGLEWAKKMNETYQQNADNWSKMQKAMGADHHAVDEYINNWKKATQQNYEDYVDKLQKKAEADKKSAEQTGNSNKQKRLDDLKKDLEKRAKEYTDKAQEYQNDGKFELARNEYEKAQKALNELHDAQQKFIGKTTSDHAKQAEKDMEETSKKMEKLINDMSALEKAQADKAKADQVQQNAMLMEAATLKGQAAAINMINPAEVAKLDAILARLQAIAALMGQISSAQLTGQNIPIRNQTSPPNSAPPVQPPTAPPQAPPAPPTTPPNSTPPAKAPPVYFPSVPPAGYELPPMEAEQKMADQEKATADHWERMKKIREKAQLDERVKAAEEDRMAKAQQRAREQQYREDVDARQKFFDEMGKETPAQRLKRLEEESSAAGDAWREERERNPNGKKTQALRSRRYEADDAYWEEKDAQDRARKALKEKRELNDEDMKFAEKLKEQDEKVQEELRSKGWDSYGHGPGDRAYRDSYGWFGKKTPNYDEEDRRAKLDEARRKANLPRDDWKKMDYEDALRQEQGAQRALKTAQEEKNSIDAVSKAKEEAASKAKARTEAEQAAAKKAAEAAAKKAAEELSYQEILDKRDKRRNPGLTQTEDAALAARQAEIEDLERKREQKLEKEWKDKNRALSEQIARENPNGLTAEMLAKEKKLEQDLRDLEREREEYRKSVQEQKAGVSAVKAEKEATNRIAMIDPAEVNTIANVNSALEETLALVKSIASINAMAASAGGAGGSSEGGGTTITNNITTNLNGGSARAASAAAIATAQNLLILRS